MEIIRCDNSFSEQILAIFNDAIQSSTALYDYKPRTVEMMAGWFETKKKGNYPVIGVVGPGRELLGFGSYGAFRAWPGYKYTVEHSIYVERNHRGKGIGKMLIEHVIGSARSQNYHVLVGAIDSQNVISLKLHESFGFRHAGTLREVGFKFGHWLDLELYQLNLDTPAEPADG